MRYGKKYVLILSSPFLISFGCFWSHFEGKPVWGWGWGVMGLGCGLFPRHPGEHPRYSLAEHLDNQPSKATSALSSSDRRVSPGWVRSNSSATLSRNSRSRGSAGVGSAAGRDAAPPMSTIPAEMSAAE